MRNQAHNVSLVKKVLTPAALALLLIASAPNTANAEGSNETTTTPVDVKYLGMQNALPIFQVDINNAAQEELFVVLKDEDGHVLYKERFNDKTFSKKFQLNPANLATMKITMTVFSKGDKNKQVFVFNNETKVVENIVVTRVQ